MIRKSPFVLLTALLVTLLFTGAAEAEELLLSVKHRFKGPKGSMCYLATKDGELTGENAEVRGFFSALDRRDEVHHLRVTTEGETQNFSADGKISVVKIYYFVAEATDEQMQSVQSTAEKIQSGDNSEVTRTEKYWMIGDRAEAAIQIPSGWTITRGLDPPIQMALRSSRKNIGVSVLKEDPVELEVDSFAEYFGFKREMMKEGLADFEPSEPTHGSIGSLNAAFFQGPGTVDKVTGELICMAIEGKKAYYLFVGVIAEGGGAPEKEELMKVLRSFREKE